MEEVVLLIEGVRPRAVGEVEPAAGVGAGAGDGALHLVSL